MKKVLAFLKKELMLTVAVVAAVVSLFITPPSLTLLKDIDWRTLGILLMMLCVLEGFKKESVLAPVVALGSGLKSMVALSLFLIFGVFFSSMFVTNDVSLIIFVPITILIFRRGGKEQYILPVITLENIAAIRGSLLMPFGSPQNLFLYGRSGVSTPHFMLHMLPLCAMSAVLLVLFVLFLYRKDPREAIMAAGENGVVHKGAIGCAGATGDNDVVNGSVTGDNGVVASGANTAAAVEPAAPGSSVVPESSAGSGVVPESSAGSSVVPESSAGSGVVPANNNLPRRIAYIIAFAAVVYAVVSRTPYWYIILGAVLVAVAINDLTIFKRVDYVLLLTFLCFFIFSSSVTANPRISAFLSRVVAGNEYWWSLGLSQLVSNVPSTIVLYPFTTNFAGLIYGADTAGLCSIIGSLASVINYRIYIREYPGHGKQFLKTFTLISWAFFLIVVIPGFLLSRWPFF